MPERSPWKQAEHLRLVVFAPQNFYAQYRHLGWFARQLSHGLDLFGRVHGSRSFTFLYRAFPDEPPSPDIWVPKDERELLRYLDGNSPNGRPRWKDKPMAG